MSDRHKESIHALRLIHYLTYSSKKGLRLLPFVLSWSRFRASFHTSFVSSLPFQSVNDISSKELYTLKVLTFLNGCSVLEHRTDKLRNFKRQCTSY